jgi:hypothetical protein
MSGRLGHAVELVSALKADTDTGLPAGVNDLLQLGVVAVTRDGLIFVGASAGLEGFFNGVDAVDNVHRFSLNGK